jgi:RNA polymerase sigma factor (sigma-70 family)
MDLLASPVKIPTALSDRDFKENLAAVIPQLRAFARNLCGNRDLADDLVQETMMKAWAARASFQAGSNFRAWSFMILRNYYFSQVRRRRFVGEWDDLTADRLLAAPAGQEKSIELQDMLRALQQLPLGQREALILVGAGGLSYEETAQITGVAIGTVKSRVARARTALEALIGNGQLESRRQDCADSGDAVINIFAYIESVKRRHEALGSVESPRRFSLAA